MSSILHYAKQVLQARAEEEKAHAQWVAEQAEARRQEDVATVVRLLDEPLGLAGAWERMWIDFPSDSEIVAGVGRGIVHVDLREGKFRSRRAHLTLDLPMGNEKNKAAVIRLDGRRAVAVRTMNWDKEVESLPLLVAEVIAEAF